MRVTNSMIFDSVIYNTNKTLAEYYALSEKNTTQREINRPSDDPGGTAVVLGLRAHVSRLEQYQANIDTARGFLTTADDALNTMSEHVTSARELAEQAATGTLSAEQRLMIADELRETFSEMLAVANTEYLDGSIFAGQRIDSDAYENSLYADVRSGTLTQADVLSVSGAAARSVLVRFADSGTVGGAADLDYQWSADGGQTWTDATLAAGDTDLVLGTCTLSLATGAAVGGEADAAGQTELLVRPAATYVGDTEDGASVTHFGASPVSAAASGVFAANVVVRIDADSDLSSTIAYSYSTDGGATWVPGNTAGGGVLPVPGGTLTLTPDGGSAVTAGDQFTIVPEQAEVRLSISDSGSVAVNNVGKDVFGGLYQATGADEATPVDGANLFETMGRLIGALETDDQDTIADCLDALYEAQDVVLQGAADVGAREGRLDSAEAALALRMESDTSLMSGIEDADLTVLMVELTAAETAYRSVVETSSTIMQLSLVNLL